MLSPADPQAIETRLHEMMQSSSDTGGLSVLETADFAIRSLNRLLFEYRQLAGLALTTSHDLRQVLITS